MHTVELLNSGNEIGWSSLLYRILKGVKSWTRMKISNFKESVVTQIS
jgi:hypothetical protein